MKCPNCGEEMIAGEMTYINAKGNLFWVPEDYYKNKTTTFCTKAGILKNGGMAIPFGNGVTRNRTKGYVCHKCNCLLMCFD